MGWNQQPQLESAGCIVQYGFLATYAAAQIAAGGKALEGMLDKNTGK